MSANTRSSACTAGLVNTAWTLSLSAPTTEKPAAFLDSRSRKRSVVFSPDGHWVAYAAFASDNAQRTEIHVTAYPGPGPHVPISTEGGALPRWRDDGREVFYRSGDKMMAVDIELGAEVRAGPPRTLFEKRYGNGFDVAPDGKRFLMIKSSASAPPNQLTFVVNWFEELKRLVPVK